LCFPCFHCLSFSLLKNNSRLVLTANLWRPNQGYLNEAFHLDIANVPAHFLLPNVVRPERDESVLFLHSNRDEIADGLYLVMHVYKYEDMIRTAGKLSQAARHPLDILTLYPLSGELSPAARGCRN
jgi:hypothetical protein